MSSVSSANGFGKVTSGVRGMWRFGLESGSLLQSWLTPSRIEDCASFWSEGSQCLARDISRVALQPQRWSMVEVRKFFVFSVVAANSFPWTPLLLPLIDRALEDKAPAWPTAFGDRRRSAVRRLSQITQPTQADFDALERTLFETPQDANEAAVFIRDGGRIILRDFRRGRIWRESKEYLRFIALAGTTLPLTPLLFTLIDKWRGDVGGARRGEYVPSAFSVRRLAALRRMQTRGGGNGASDYAATLRAAAAEASGARPRPAALLTAILAAEKQAQVDSRARALFQDKLAGGGSPGRRWRLIYSADKAAVVAARRRGNRNAAGGGAAGGRLPSAQELLPWKDGLYLDRYVSAVQRFDASLWENENGVFALLGSDVLQFRVQGPFKWPQPERRAICAFRPTVASLRLFGFSKEFPLDHQAPFQEAPLSQLPFFKFVHVDDTVAVAIGRSGGAALWARIHEP